MSDHDARFGPGRGDARWIARRVRSHAFTTGIAAGLLLFFGFYYSPSGITGNPIYDGSVALFTWTLKIGGIVLAIATLGCLAGAIGALAIDGAASLVIGALILIAGGVWLVYGDFQGFLNLLFAAMFLHAGWGELIEFAALRGGALGSFGVRGRPGVEAPPVRPNVGDDSALATLVRRKRGEETEPATTGEKRESQPEASPTRSADAESPPASTEAAPVADVEPEQPADESAPPPEGFLAALAKEHKPPKKST